MLQNPVDELGTVRYAGKDELGRGVSYYSSIDSLRDPTHLWEIALNSFMHYPIFLEILGQLSRCPIL